MAEPIEMPFGLLTRMHLELSAVVLLTLPLVQHYHWWLSSLVVRAFDLQLVVASSIPGRGTVE